MATTRAADIDTLTQRLKALSDPNRLRIMDRLRSGEKCVCDLSSVLGAGQSLLSFHLKVLKDAGLVHDRRDGRWSWYTLDTGALEEVREFVAALTEIVPQSRWTACCG